MARLLKHLEDSRWILSLLLAVIYFSVASLSLKLAFEQANTSPVWPPTGIAIAALLFWGRSAWPGVAIGALLVNWASGLPLTASVAIALGNALEAVIAATLVLRYASAYPFKKVAHVFVFLLVLPLATSISAIIGITSLHYLAGIPAENLSLLWTTWWLGDLSGGLLITPLLLTWLNYPGLYLHRKQLAEAMLGFSFALALAIVTFSDLSSSISEQNQMAFLLLPPMIWAALRFRQQGAMLLAFALSVIAIIGTLYQYGPFVRDSVNQSLLLLQTFMGVITTTALILAASRSERLAVEKQLLVDNVTLEQHVKNRTSELRMSSQQLKLETQLRDQSTQAMFTLMEATARQTGESFLRSCVKDLARVYETRYAFIGVFADDTRQSINTRAVWAGDNYDDNFSYLLAGTPCEDVLNQKIELIPRHVQQEFPQDELLVQMDIESYFGVPILDSNNELTGLVVVMDTKPMSPHPWLIPILGIFANRIALELERNVRQRELELAATVFNIGNEAVIICDQDARILRANEAFTQITGYTQEEAYGQTPRLLQSGHHDEEFYRQLWASINETGSWQGELWDRRKNGESFPTWHSISELKNEAGVVQHYISVFHDVTDKKMTEERLYQLAHYDILTNLPNRAAFGDMVTHEIQHAKRHQKKLAMLFLDLDHFKHVNDSLGHHCGDLLLQQIARRLQMTVRSEDFIARLGGDEFTVLLRDLKHKDDVISIVEKILRVIVKPIILDNTEVVVGTSIGISTFPENSTDATNLLKQADTAMYQAKAKGRNTYQFFTPDMNRQAGARITLENELRRAIRNEEFVIHYQPQINLKREIIVGCEALLRWQHPDKGLIIPDEFMQVAEESGLIVPIGNWVLKTACQQTAEWHQAGFAPLNIAINLSARQFMRQDLIQVVQEAINCSNIDPNQLEFELTESMIMSDAEDSQSTLQALRGMGVSLSIDDFGTGFSSLSYLKQFPINKLKIDRSFISDLYEGSNDAAIVKAIISLGRDLNLTVIAEGVEQLEELNFLKQYGCDEIQGHYVSPPVTAQQIKQLLNNTQALKIAI